MNDSPALTLLLQTGLKSPAQDVAFIQAFAHPLLPTLKAQTESLTLIQTFKPHINDLVVMGFDVAPLQGEFDLILMIPSKDKVLSLAWLADAFLHLKAGGKLLVACENQYGAKSYESALKRLAGNVSSNSKSKCRLFSAKKTQALDESLQHTWLQDAKPKQIDTHGLWAQAGLFSWKSADVGSTLLLENLPELQGEGMDLCCGYGLLTAAILKQSTPIKHVHMVEAEGIALTCAQKNLQGYENVSYYHVDAREEALPKHLDWIVCNPPFHTGQARDVELGQTIVTRACECLKFNGELYLVANRQLPYERTLKTLLREVECVAVGNGFKVIRGKK